MHSNVHCSTIYNIPDMEATYMSINRGMDFKKYSTYVQWTIVSFSSLAMSDSFATPWTVAS